jgi:hypothetical protein
MKPTITVAAALVLMLALAACSEKPQRVMTETQSADEAAVVHDDLRERTLRQGEAGRMAY